MSGPDPKVPAEKPGGAVEQFLETLARTPKPGAGGRLLFIMDATASREPTWEQASRIQTEMFVEAASHGGLSIQLCFFRGFGECRASSWIGDAETLARRMASVTCVAGHTQIRKALQHALTETKTAKVDAIVYVGDCMEESVDDLGRVAGELGLLGVPVFLFQEGRDPIAGRAFGHIAKLTRGAHVQFDPSSPKVLRDLLKAVAVFAAGGRLALDDFAKRTRGEVLKLTAQVK